jgi:hypothetical protein
METFVKNKMSKKLTKAQVCTLVIGIIATIVSWALPVDFPIGEEIWLPLITAVIGIIFGVNNRKAVS